MYKILTNNMKMGPRLFSRIVEVVNTYFNEGHTTSKEKFLTGKQFWNNYFQPSFHTHVTWQKAVCEVKCLCQIMNFLQNRKGSHFSIDLDSKNSFSVLGAPNTTLVDYGFHSKEVFPLTAV